MSVNGKSSITVTKLIEKFDPNDEVHVRTKINDQKAWQTKVNSLETSEKIDGLDVVKLCYTNRDNSHDLFVEFGTNVQSENGLFILNRDSCMTRKEYKSRQKIANAVKTNAFVIEDWSFDEKRQDNNAWTLHPFDYAVFSAGTNVCPVTSLDQIKKQQSLSLDYKPMTEEMMKCNPNQSHVKNCCFAILTQGSTVLAEVGKIGQKFKHCKRECALAILKYLDHRKQLQPLSATRLETSKYLRVFIFYCSVEFSWRGQLDYIYNTKGFQQFLIDMKMYDDVEKLHHQWAALNSEKDKPEYWIRENKFYDPSNPEIKAMNELERKTHWNKLKVQKQHLDYKGKQHVTLEQYYDNINVDEAECVWEFRGAKWVVDSIIDRKIVVPDVEVEEGNDVIPCGGEYQVTGVWYLVVWTSVNGEKFVDSFVHESDIEAKHLIENYENAQEDGFILRKDLTHIPMPIQDLQQKHVDISSDRELYTKNKKINQLDQLEDHFSKEPEYTLPAPKRNKIY